MCALNRRCVMRTSRNLANSRHRRARARPTPERVHGPVAGAGRVGAHQSRALRLWRQHLGSRAPARAPSAIAATEAAEISARPLNAIADSRGVAAALGAALLFGLSTPIAKLLLRRVEPWTLSAILYWRGPGRDGVASHTAETPCGSGAPTGRPPASARHDRRGRRGRAGSLADRPPSRHGGDRFVVAQPRGRR